MRKIMSKIWILVVMEIMRIGCKKDNEGLPAIQPVEGYVRDSITITSIDSAGITTWHL